jgi:DNA-binding NtrC family response regulator
VRQAGAAPSQSLRCKARAICTRPALPRSPTGETVGLDIRPMATVDPGIETSVHHGRVREDLFGRLSVIRSDLPPVRSRREDLPALANFFVREVCAARAVPPKT